MKGRTNVWNSAVPSTPAGIAAAGGVTNFQVEVWTNPATSSSILTNVIISTPISTLTTGAVVTVAPSQSKRIYQVSASTPITLTNDLSQLGANCTTNYEWETWINYTDTNALSTVWDSRIRWQQQTPDLTVTGLYKFAMSTACGTIIQARQTYPTVYQWATPECQLLSGSMSAYPITLSGAGAGTNSFYGAKISKNSYEIFKFLLYGHGLTNAVTLFNARRVLQVDAYYGSTLNVPGLRTTFFQPTMLLTMMSGTETGDGFSATASGDFGYVAGFRLQKPGPGAITINTALWRPANELEIAAYNAGWRP
jgi:hypothetical protein